MWSHYKHGRPWNMRHLDVLVGMMHTSVQVILFKLGTFVACHTPLNKKEKCPQNKVKKKLGKVGNNHLIWIEKADCS